MSGENTLLRHRFTGLAIGAVGLALAGGAALAQDYGSDGADENGQNVTTTQELTVTGERHARSSIGAPIQWVSTQRTVYTADIDLSTPWGARELRARVQKAAQTACSELDTFHPITADDSPDCYKAAVNEAMAQAEEATGYKLASD